MLNTVFDSLFDPKVTGDLLTRLGTKPGRALVGAEVGFFRFSV